MAGILLPSKCCCDNPGPCTSPFLKCPNCDWQWMPRWLIQCMLPGIVKASWILTRTGQYRWECQDDKVHWVFSIISSTQCTIQCWFGDNYVS